MNCERKLPAWNRKRKSFYRNLYSKLVDQCTDIRHVPPFSVLVFVSAYAIVCVPSCCFSSGKPFTSDTGYVEHNEQMDYSTNGQWCSKNIGNVISSGANSNGRFPRENLTKIYCKLINIGQFELAYKI